MIIDSHLHFYDLAHHKRDAGDSTEHLSFDDVLRDARAIGIGKITQVTPVAVGYDNSYSFTVAERYPEDVLGVIARLDPLAPDIETQLIALLRRPKMLALRLTLIDKQNVTWLADRTLDPFFALASRLGLPIELFAPFRVAEMHETVRRFPDIRWLIDHMGLRYYAGQDNRGAFRQWDDLLTLAALPNAWIKCAYFPEAAKDLEAYPYPVAADYLRRLHDAAPERLIWGSNYPNVLRACTYAQSLDFIRKECDFLGPDERRAILGGNFLRYVKREPFGN
jgi:predicted TIM-barrel fold metal-dependent hydrolase